MNAVLKLIFKTAVGECCFKKQKKDFVNILTRSLYVPFFFSKNELVLY